MGFTYYGKDKRNTVAVHGIALFGVRDAVTKQASSIFASCFEDTRVEAFIDGFHVELFLFCFFSLLV